MEVRLRRAGTLQNNEAAEWLSSTSTSISDLPQPAHPVSGPEHGSPTSVVEAA